jgi:hypothetical protein
MTVTVYSAGKPIGQRTIFDASDVAAAINSVMHETKLDHCAARVEDDNKSGAWLLVGSKGASGAADLPGLKR